MAKTVKYIQSVAGTGANSRSVGDVESLGDTAADALIAAGVAVLAHPQASVRPAEIDDTDAGNSIDFGASATPRYFRGVQIVGGVGGTTPSLTGKFQESADDSNWTDITGTGLTAVTAASNTQAVVFSSSKRYLRHFRTVSGTSPTFNLCATIERISSVSGW